MSGEDVTFRVKCRKMLELPIEVTDYVANGSFESLRDNVTLLDTEDYAFYVRNTDLKSNTYTKFVTEESYRFLSKSVLYGNEVIISNVADVGSVYLCPTLKKPMTLGSNVIMLRSEDNVWSYFMYLYFRYFKGRDQIVEITTGSAQPKFNKTAFRNLDINVPEDRYLQHFNKFVAPIFHAIEINNIELREMDKIKLSFLATISSR